VTFPALLDTCVLYPAYLCDTLLRLAEAEAYRPLWSADILTELRRNVVEAGIPADRVDRRIAQMSHSFPDAMVTGYDSLIDGMTNDPKDRHEQQAASYRREPTTIAGLLPLLERAGLPQFTAEVRRHVR
jgi:hypothetical protein